MPHILPKFRPPPARPDRDRLGVALGLAAGLTAGWVVLTAVWPPAAGPMMRRFHLRNHSFAAFAALAPVPAMYNFENRVRWVPSAGADRDEPGGGRYFNHYPARLMTFIDDRPWTLRRWADQALELDTRFRGQRLVTRYRVERRDDGAPRVAR